MKNKLFTLMLILSTSLLVNCKQGNRNNAPAPVVSPAAAACTSPGYVNTQYGCVPQGTCGANQGSYNGVCYPATTLTSGTCPANFTYSNGTCYLANATSSSCLSTDMVTLESGAVVAIGVCQPYCSTYNARYGYYQGQCWKSVN